MTDDAPATWRDVEFRRSSFSGANGGNCVELTWRNAGSGDTASGGAAFGVRDSKNTIGPVLATTGESGRAFLTAIKHGQSVVL